VTGIRGNGRVKNADKELEFFRRHHVQSDYGVLFPTYLVQSFRRFYILHPRSTYSRMALCKGGMAILSTFLSGKAATGLLRPPNRLCVCVFKCVFMYVFMCVFMCVCSYVYTFKCVHVCVCSCVYSSVCSYVYWGAHLFICVCSCLCLWVYLHACVFVCVCVCSCVQPHFNF
jgi:membrane associated rhomboid family serine protease